MTITLGRALVYLGEAVNELADDDARKSRRNRITEVSVRYAAVLEVYGEVVKEMRNAVRDAVDKRGTV